LVVAPLRCDPEPSPAAPAEAAGAATESPDAKGPSVPLPSAKAPDVTASTRACPQIPASHSPVPAPAQEQGGQTITANKTTERKETNMKTTNRIIEMQPSAALPAAQTETNDAGLAASAVVQARDQIEKVKETFRSAISDLNETSKLLSQAAREKKATEREIESVRTTLRSLQRVQI
jgi:hypothetical protein